MPNATLYNYYNCTTGNQQKNVANSLIQYRSKSLWMGDSWIALICYYLLEHFPEAYFKQKFEPIKPMLLEGLENGVRGHLPGALDMGIDTVTEEGLEHNFVEMLKELIEKIIAKGSVIKKEELWRIEQKHYDPLKKDQMKDIEVSKLVEKIEDVIKLLEDIEQ